MRPRTIQWLGFAAAALGMVLAIYCLMPEVFINTRTVILGAEADGLKTYFTFLYHVKFDDLYTQFGGMNYPFGEHIIFTDNQPVAVMFSQTLKNFGLPLSNPQLVLNLLIVCSLVLTAPVLFLIFRKLRIPPAFAVASSIVITLMAPQILRFPYHEGLAHTVFIPLTWLLILNFFEKPKFAISATLAAFLLFTSGIHPYCLLINTSFVIAAWAGRLLTERTSRSKLFATHFLIQVCSPLAAYTVWTKLTDSIVDRVNPGASSLYYRAHFESIFLPYVGSPFRPYLDKVLRLHKELPIESIAYVGCLASLILLFTLFRVFRKFRTRVFISRPLLRARNWKLQISIFAGFITLIYSLGYPWIIIGESFFLKMGVLSQFRALGRFAWIFFYVFSVFSFYRVFVINRMLKMRGRTALARTLVIMAFAVSSFEALSWSRPVFTALNESAKLKKSLDFSPELKDLISKENLDSYQAFIPLPFFQAGSEGVIPRDFRERENPISFQDSVGVAYKTGLPMVAQALSRTSISQSKSTFALFTGASEKRLFVESLPNNRPILIIVGPEKLHAVESQFLKHRKLLRRSKNYGLYVIDISEI
ncbi:MAG: hypothetical protein EOP06_02445 [Proteobacteria bacterium]|nr:MAG: hypothetical protein EOP06_02445 [Pseudomonadota bacterium]